MFATTMAPTTMSTTENRALIRRYLEAISGKEKPAALVDRYVAESDLSLKQHIMSGEVGFPRYELVEEEMLAEDDKVMVRFTFRGVHKGEFMGIPATGKPVSVPGVIIYRIANGKIIDHWMLMDSMTMMQQLGVKG
ncbi:MAG TPA: ester cyclase [Caldilineaceae bacterium]|nr:ester cyclase [Caldilineaceae bacterium]